MKNKSIAKILYKIADLLDIKGEIFFKTRAYRIAAQTIETLNEDIETVANENRLKSIPGVGEALAGKIYEIIKTDKSECFEKLKNEIPESLLKILEIQGLGPRKVSSLYKNLGITTISELKMACVKGELRDLDGFGKISERNILRGLQLYEKTSGRVLLNVAHKDGDAIIDYLKNIKEIKQVDIAGSLRREMETIGDLDILSSSDRPDTVMDYFIKYPEVKEVLMKGSTKTSVILNDGLQVDLRVVENKSYGSALQYFTGSKEHNVKIRSHAIKKGFKLNEYGLFNKITNEFLGGKTEEEIYNKLGLIYIDPELRENRGEIKVALNNTLPNLVRFKNIKGDLHVHSLWSDGYDSIEKIAKYAQKMNYEFIGITDHSQSLKIAKGLSEEKVKKKINEIEKINKKLSRFRILCGTECDIKSDGVLDYSNRTLKTFDFVGVGIHTNFKINGDKQTKRIIKAIENENVDFLAHPTCRIIGRRKPFDLDMEKIFDAARDTNTYLEINSFPDRLDLNDVHSKLAKERGVKFVIGTDSHSVKDFQFIRFGISTARRGWLEKRDILNACPLKEIEKILDVNN